MLNEWHVVIGKAQPAEVSPDLVINNIIEGGSPDTSIFAQECIATISRKPSIWKVI